MLRHQNFVRVQTRNPQGSMHMVSVVFPRTLEVVQWKVIKSEHMIFSYDSEIYENCYK